MCGKTQRRSEFVGKRQLTFCWKNDLMQEEKVELDSFALITQTWPDTKLKDAE